MMDQRTLTDLIRLTADALEAEGIRYALTGSVASSIHGERFTSEDADFVVQMSPAQAERLAGRFKEGFYADAAMLRNAAMNRDMASIYDLKRGLKIDSSVLSDTDYHREVLKRRMQFQAPDWDHRFYVVSPEDIILMKLWWRRDTRSAKQWENAPGVARVQGARLDWKYLRHWAHQMGLEQDLNELMREAGIQ